MTVYQNKITLLKIMKCISCMEYQSEFVNKLFEPLKKANSSYFIEGNRKGYIGKNTKTFMNGNYSKETNKKCLNYNNIIRQNTVMLDDFSKKLQDSIVFNNMINSIKKITDIKPLTKEHYVFDLIDLDIDNMPENFINCLKYCLDSGSCYEALLFLILWSISGEYIKIFSDIYEDFPLNIAQLNFNRKETGVIRLLSNTKPCRPVFKGRDTFLLQMHEHYRKKGHFLFLQGIGGIGKSELSKQYAENYKSDYDVIIFAECSDSLISTVNNDNVFALTEPFVPRNSSETEYQYYQRKLNQMKKSVDRTLVILDNVDYFSEDMESFLSLPFDIIITTRYNYSDDYSENVKLVSHIDDKQILREIFSEYYGRNVDDDPFVDSLIDMFENHTMAVELVAKQAKVSGITPEQIYNILLENDESKLIESFRVLNYDSKQRNITEHLSRLFNIASLNNEEKYIIMCLSIIPITGIDKKIFKKCSNIVDFSAINGLVERSWIRETDGFISCHALIQETIKLTLEPDLIKCIDFINRLTEEFPAVEFYHLEYSKKVTVKQSPFKRKAKTSLRHSEVKITY